MPLMYRAAHQPLQMKPEKNRGELFEDASPVGARLGVRWQGGSRDTAFARTTPFLNSEIFRPRESGVALRFPPQSKTRSESILFFGE